MGRLALTLHNIGWAAGFFEGEGHAGYQQKGKYGRLILSLCQVGRSPLDAFKAAVEVGEVRGPYGPYQANKKPFYQYNVSGDKAALVIEMLLPFLFEKGEQARIALQKYRDYKSGKSTNTDP